MKKLLFILIIGIAFISCENVQKESAPETENWKQRSVQIDSYDTLISGTSYLSVYSQIYSMSESRKHNLTATISMRNTNRHDTVYIIKADYFNTEGQLIKSYLDRPIYLAPMETIEIVIAQIDESGGTGANFVFDWKTKDTSNEPYFESVMISTANQLGLSFSRQGVRIN
jgi:hypothetical protein